MLRNLFVAAQGAFQRPYQVQKLWYLRGLSEKDTEFFRSITVERVRSFWVEIRHLSYEQYAHKIRIKHAQYAYRF